MTSCKMAVNRLLTFLQVDANTNERSCNNTLVTKIRRRYCSQVALLREVRSVKKHQTGLVDTNFLRKLEQFLIFGNNDYRAFSLDVTAAILMFQNIETERQACWCPKTIQWELKPFLATYLA